MKILFFILNQFLSFTAVAQLLENRVLVIKNINSPVSIAVANDYSLRRNVPKILSIACLDSSINSNSEFISYTDYLSNIKNPIENYLTLHPEIDFIVLTKGIPIKIYGAPNKPNGGDCTVDSLLASLGYENNPTSSIVNFDIPDGANNFTGQAFANKYWNSQIGFSHATFGGYLVTRLDGYTQADAIALTTRSLQAEINIGIQNSGTILLDACGSFGFDNNFVSPTSILPNNHLPGQAINVFDDYQYSNFNSDILLTNNQLVATGNEVLYDANTVFIGNVANLNGYISWGSNDTNYNASSYNSLTFRAGALADTAVSTGARTFLQGNAGQSLIVDLISQGATGVKGYAIEPLLLGVGSPSIMFNRYTNGWTMAESFYASAKLIGWMDVMIGDPICIAYANNLSASNFEKNNKTIVYPNPSSNNIRINIKEFESFFIKDILGKKVLEINIYNNQPIDVSKLEIGIYFIVTKNETLKFIKN